MLSWTPAKALLLTRMPVKFCFFIHWHMQGSKVILAAGYCRYQLPDKNNKVWVHGLILCATKNSKRQYFLWTTRSLPTGKRPRKTPLIAAVPVLFFIPCEYVTKGKLRLTPVPWLSRIVFKKITTLGKIQCKIHISSPLPSKFTES